MRRNTSTHRGGCRCRRRPVVVLSSSCCRPVVVLSSSCCRPVVGRCLAHALVLVGLLNPARRPTGRTGQPKIARRESRHPPELHSSQPRRCLGAFRLQGRKGVLSALFRFVSTYRPTTSSGASCSRSRAENKVTARPRVFALIPRAREPCGVPIDAQWGAGRARLLHGARYLLPRAEGLSPLRATAMNSRAGVWIGWVTRQSNDRWQEEGRGSSSDQSSGRFSQVGGKPAGFCPVMQA
ncbi:hypothetical protein B0T18DRAFT_186984 [Schizothecium vesticola]|uniref:Uncharacterized protein n=1 Tax=Schizothecium vesticola TaxID=314040 RepID=A0AA40EQE5_9PEZI|nr:hypothetical protein B0T18DRAFT_186984 [Schizothecium vesticola]